MVSSISARVLLFGLLASSALASSPLAAPAPLCVPQGGRADQVYRENPRNGRITTLNGKVIENTLTTVRMEVRGKVESHPASEILRIEWGMLPPSFRDAETLLERGDFENAVAQFRIAAGDASARPVVQADARLRAAKALLSWGAKDSTQFAQAASEAERFLSDHTDNRAVPAAAMLRARAQHMAGSGAQAAANYEALYQKGVAATQGYDIGLCLSAALASAQAYLGVGNTLKARELFTAADTGIASHLNSLTDASESTLAHLAGQRGTAAAGEGFCLLAGGDANGAQNFFEGRLRKADATPAERHASELGLAKVHLAAGKNREALVLFATVSALEASDRDRVAAALLGLAESTLAVGSSSAQADAKRALTQVVESYGDTLSAAEAALRLSKL
ncbi:MAG: hypothetical protein ACI8QC_003962 [Planctomycetota bacterium]|jgi:hypothetical protein